MKLNLNTVKLACFSALLLTVGTLVPSLSHAIDEPALDENFILYEFKPGDSLKDLAETHLGGSEFAMELLAYNDLSDSTSLREGTLLAIPTKIREEAIAALRKAEDRLFEASQKKAEVYALKEFRQAQSAIAKAREVRNQAIYDKTIALSRTSQLKSQRAIDIADINVWEDRLPVVTATNGKVEQKLEGGQWNPVAVGDQLALNATIRTAEDARATLTFHFKLHGSSVVQILEGTHMLVSTCRENNRDNFRNTRLKVIMGNIIGEIAPKKKEDNDTNFDIDAGKAAIAIRGTKLRVGADTPNDMRVSLLETTSDIEVMASAERVDVNVNEGTFSINGQQPAPPIPLANPPKQVFPDAQSPFIASLTPTFTWTPQPGPKAVKYHFELSSDESFLTIVQNSYPNEPQFTSQLLPEGKYFWRVSAIEKNNLEGKYSDTRTFTVRKNLLFNIERQPADAVIGGKEFAQPGYRLAASPAVEPSSISHFEYSRDNGATFQRMNTAVLLSLSQTHQVALRPIAADGSVGETQTVEVTIDGRYPTTTHEVAYRGEAKQLNRSASVTLKSDDASRVQSIEYSLDGKSFVTYEAPFDVGLLTDQRILYRATDVLGNISPPKELYLKGIPIGR